VHHRIVPERRRATEAARDDALAHGRVHHRKRVERRKRIARHRFDQRGERACHALDRGRREQVAA
jgi:hypothetical protein